MENREDDRSDGFRRILTRPFPPRKNGRGGMVPAPRWQPLPRQPRAARSFRLDSSRFVSFLRNSSWIDGASVDETKVSGLFGAEGQPRFPQRKGFFGSRLNPPPGNTR